MNCAKRKREHSQFDDFENALKALRMRDKHYRSRNIFKRCYCEMQKINWVPTADELFSSVRHNRHKCVEYMLNLDTKQAGGVDCTVVWGQRRLSPVQIAVQNRDHAMLRILISHGANIHNVLGYGNCMLAWMMREDAIGYHGIGQRTKTIVDTLLDRSPQDGCNEDMIPGWVAHPPLRRHIIERHHRRVSAISDALVPHMVDPTSKCGSRVYNDIAHLILKTSGDYCMCFDRLFQIQRQIGPVLL